MTMRRNALMGDVEQHVVLKLDALSGSSDDVAMPGEIKWWTRQQVLLRFFDSLSSAKILPVWMHGPGWRVVRPRGGSSGHQGAKRCCRSTVFDA